MIGMILPGYFLLKGHSSQSNLAENSKPQDVVIAQSHELTKNIVKKQPAKEEPSAHPNYEFYNLLSSEEEPGTKSDETKEVSSNQFTLKIAAVKTYSEADQLKAQLSLLGMDHVSIAKSSTGSRYPYKVIVGPFSSRAQALKIKKELKDNNISGEIIAP
jgi:cell division protein FtsN